MHTLYVARDKRRPSFFDAGSILCLNLSESLEERLQIVEVTAQSPRPPWLAGTPTLHLNTDRPGDSRILEGTEAVTHLQAAVIAAAETRGRTQTRTVSSRRATMTPAVVQVRSTEERGVPPETDAVTDGGGHADAEEGGLSGLWESRIEEVEDDNDRTEGGKFTSDDLSRALQERRPPTAPARPAGGEPPPLPPLKD